ncbi:MAG: AMP-binding protein [Microbacteriaceae bacterium]|nr:AMP-binding protein [Microbacteriaceae bacterium]MBT5730582.1 AMP-binding protein [Microbacteriaceae bacterium]
MRELRVIDSSDPTALCEPLHEALFADGPALLPRPGGVKISATAPTEVEDDVALVVETSGTTGAPKRVALGAQALVASAEAATARLGDPGTWLLVLPAHYIAGIQVITRSLIHGNRPLVLDPGPFSGSAVLARSAELISAAGSGSLYTAMVPAQLSRLLDDEADVPGLGEVMRAFSAILVGGQSIPQAVLDRAHDAGYRIIRTYGSAETAGGCVWDQRPIGDVRVAEFDGRLAISGSVLAHGYVDNPQRTETSFVQREGTQWYLTDDAGEVDSDGLVHVHGRLDDVIISGGVKVSLGRIEKLLHAHIDSADLVVVGCESDQWGHVPVVVTTAELDLERLRLLVQQELGPEARPERIHRVEALTFLPSGKPDRLALSALVAQGQA